MLPVETLLLVFHMMQDDDFKKNENPRGIFANHTGALSYKI